MCTGILNAASLSATIENELICMITRETPYSSVIHEVIANYTDRCSHWGYRCRDEQQWGYCKPRLGCLGV